MTGEHRDYSDIAEAIRDLSLSPRNDHHELYDRVVASVALGNTDDHLRNHGSRSTSIMGADTLPDEIDGLLALTEDCSLTVDQGRERMRSTASSLSRWRDQARKNRISEHEITLMAQSIEPRLTAVGEAGGGVK